MHSQPRGRGSSVRQRLLDAANRRFRADGYESTTAASIAGEAGVTERTFFRYFPTKADVLLANWKVFGEEMQVALASSTSSDPLDVARDGVLLFADRVAGEFRGGLAAAVKLFTDRTAFVALMRTLLDVETQLAAELARRTGRSKNDFTVRVCANASMGVLRAAIRAHVFDPRGPSIGALVDEGMTSLQPLFARLR